MLQNLKNLEDPFEGESPIVASPISGGTLSFLTPTMAQSFSSIFQHHKPFFINIDTYRDILVQIRPFFDNFWPLKLYVQYEAFICPKYEVSICPTLCPNFSFPRLAIFE